MPPPLGQRTARFGITTSRHAGVSAVTMPIVELAPQRTAPPRAEPFSMITPGHAGVSAVTMPIVELARGGTGVSAVTMPVALPDPSRTAAG